MMECKQAIMDSHRCCYRVGSGGGGGVVRVNLHTPVEVAPTGSITVGHKRKSNTPRSHPALLATKNRFVLAPFTLKCTGRKEKKMGGLSGAVACLWIRV